jgi:diguanylate cyclase (GGDEF)-like protein
VTVTIEPGSMPSGRMDEETSMTTPATDAVPIVPASSLDWLTPPTGWTDTLTTMDGPIFWARLVAHESARIRRYKRPATVVILEVMGLAQLRQLWGAEVAVETLIQVGATITKQIRSSDAAARIGPNQFGVYLPETNEIDAINFVERTRSAIARTLGRKADTITVGIGWASPRNGSLDDAVQLSETRLARDAREAASS